MGRGEPGQNNKPLDNKLLERWRRFPAFNLEIRLEIRSQMTLKTDQHLPPGFPFAIVLVRGLCGLSQIQQSQPVPAAFSDPEWLT